MSSFHVFVTAKLVPSVAISRLVAEGYSVDVYDSEEASTEEELCLRIKNADALFCIAPDKITEKVIDSGKKLKVVATMSSGTDHIDKKALKERNILLGHTPRVLSTACAELIICLTLMTMRKTLEGAAAVRNGQWPTIWLPLWNCGATIEGSRIGLLGFGDIGQAVAKRLKPFSPAKVLYNCPNKKDSDIEQQLGVEWCKNLDDMLKDVDVLIVCCALNSETRLILSEQKLLSMKKGSYLINASRGAVMDQDALVKVLQSGHFAGVGLDVTTPEPLPIDHPLLNFPEVTILPHIASAAVSARMAMATMTSDNIIAAFKNQTMPGEFNL